MDIPEIKPLGDDGSQDSTMRVATPSTADSGFFSFRKGQNYYVTGGRKAGDFFAGVFLPLVLYFTVSFFAPILVIAGIVCCFIFRRWWLAIGMIVHLFLLLPLLFFFLIMGLW